MKSLTDVQIKLPFGEALQRFSNVNTKDLTETEAEEKNAAPFVKWVGGKRSIINELIVRLPKEFNEYYEPFVGGGALFFELQNKIKKAHLSDMNLDLIMTYQIIKKRCEELIKALEEHSKKHSEEYYYKVRTKHDFEDPVKIAARLIYLNRTCYNGLFRTNKKGEFNVPFGRYSNPDIIRKEQLRACSKALQKVTIKYQDFAKTNPTSKDFVYFDPPYHPTNETSFTTYTKGDFSEQDQTRLRDFIVELNKKGVLIMLSNSDTEFIRSIYKNNLFKIAFVNAPRSVNCKADKRNPTREVLITNY